MSKPIDFKTVKIYEHLKEKPSLDNKVFKTLNPDMVYDILSNNSPHDIGMSGVFISCSFLVLLMLLNHFP